MTAEPVAAFPAAIPAAIAKIMGAVGAVEKRGTNEFHRYKYATAADLLYKLQPLMAEHGLVVMQTEVSKDFIRDASVMVIEYDFQLVHTSGAVWPERTRQTGVSRCLDSKGGFDDKAANKCHTAARKYFLLALFQVPTGDYDDADKGDADGHNPPQRQGNGAVRQATPAPLPPAPPSGQPSREMTFDPPGSATDPKSLAIELGVNDRGTVAWTHWVEQFESYVEGSDTAKELELLVKDNTMTLQQLKDRPKGGGAYDKLMALVDARRNKLLGDDEKPNPMAA